MTRLATAIALLLAPVLLAVGCGGAAKEPLPSVLGIELDDAHNRLKADDFKRFHDQDSFGDRSILFDANWVVLRQEPAPGTPVERGDTVTLYVGKIGEARTTQQLPADSPVLLEQQQKRSASPTPAPATPKADNHVEILRSYINDIDPLLRIGVRTFDETRTVGSSVARNAYGDTQDDVLEAGLLTVRTLRDRIDGMEPPKGSKRAGTHEQLVGSCDQLVQAMETLLSADGSLRRDSVARYNDVRRAAVAGWNSSVTALYAETDVKPPLVS